MKFQCDTLGFCEDCENTAPNEVCCNVSLCQDFQSHATVKLKVPTYGLCVAKPWPAVRLSGIPRAVEGEQAGGMRETVREAEERPG